ncbi:MAG: sulfate adenylyltransferase [Candidatus Thorarchaeota archaeon]
MQRPHGGRLVERTISKSESERISDNFHEYPTMSITKEIAQEIDNIAHGVFSPLDGFLNRVDFEMVLEHGRLANDVPWTIPIVFDVDEETLADTTEGDMVGLVYNGTPTATLEVEDIYEYDKSKFAESVFGTTDARHPGVAKVMNMADTLVGGRVRLLNEIGNPYPDFTLRPKETRILFKEKDWHTVVAFQTRNPPHLGHEYVQKTALSMIDGIFINPLIGKKKTGDFKDPVILRAYKTLMRNYYLQKYAVLAVLHTEMRYGGPREAIHHAIMRKNFGCTHFIVGRDHAGVGDFYGPLDAHYIFEEYPDLGISPICFASFFYCKECNSIANDKICPHDSDQHVIFSGTKIRGMLSEGRRPPPDVMRPEVADTILEFDEPFVE